MELLVYSWIRPDGAPHKVVQAADLAQLAKRSARGPVPEMGCVQMLGEDLALDGLRSVSAVAVDWDGHPDGEALGGLVLHRGDVLVAW